MPGPVGPATADHRVAPLRQRDRRRGPGRRPLGALRGDGGGRTLEVYLPWTLVDRFVGFRDYPFSTLRDVLIALEVQDAFPTAGARRCGDHRRRRGTARRLGACGAQGRLLIDRAADVPSRTRRRPPDRVHAVRARLPVFAYWARWPVIGLLVLALKAVFGSVGPADWIAVALLASTVWLRTRICALDAARVVLLVVVGWILVTGFGVHWAGRRARHRRAGRRRLPPGGVVAAPTDRRPAAPVGVGGRQPGEPHDDDAVQLVDALTSSGARPDPAAHARARVPCTATARVPAGR